MAGIKGMRWGTDNLKSEKKRAYLFVSLPMAGRPEDYIRDRQQEILKAANENSKEFIFALIDTFSKEEAPEINVPSLWYLGDSIRLLGMADLVIFDKDWRKARGCRVEHAICELYGIPYMYVDSEDRYNDEQDL